MKITTKISDGIVTTYMTTGGRFNWNKGLYYQNLNKGILFIHLGNSEKGKSFILEIFIMAELSKRR